MAYIKASKKEAHSIQEMLMQARTFKVFCKSTEVLDINKHKSIKNKNALFQVYAKGLKIDSSLFIINKN